ncbi:MAG: hypothetical protein AAGG44_13950, partial [Planctomycetota bacterium]
AAGFEPAVDFQLSNTKDGLRISTWDSSKAKPTDQQINDWSNDVNALPSGKLFSDWQAENGGDPAKTLRRQAIETIDTSDPVQRMILRAMAGIIDARFGQIIDALNPMLPEADRLTGNRSIAELETAMKAIIDSGMVDDQ